ncbi:hypothetical protein FRC03_005826 [Tulasnella sp. 419]|nr:hypothetical protein FRC03_005826 [Tulasnella sp. 419]
MSTPTSPPILEIEDRPQSIPRPESPPPDNPQSIPPPSDNPKSTPPPPTVRKKQRTANLQVKDVADPHINDHAPFWSIYNKEADEFDAEMLKAWNNSLDVLLIFVS